MVNQLSGILQIGDVTLFEYRVIEACVSNGGFHILDLSAFELDMNLAAQ